MYGKFAREWAVSTILHIVRNTVTHDSRVLKETGSILERFPEKKLVIAGFQGKDCLEQELIGERLVARWRLATRPLPKDLFSQSLKYIEWRHRLLNAYSHEPLQIIHCHDLEPLWIAVGLKMKTASKLIYDAHELETERNGSRGIRRALSRFQEKYLMPYVDHLITVSPSIRDWYAQRYPNKPISLVRNIPQVVGSGSNSVELRKYLEIPAKALLFLYLGALNKGRGIEAILQGFEGPRIRHHVLFMGSGPFVSKIKSYSGRCRRIHYLPPVQPNEVISYARGADVGLCLTEDSCLSYRYSLPNKLFECLLSGLPVLASSLPDMTQIIRDYKGGWVIEPNATALLQFLEHLDPLQARQVRHGLLNRVADLRWENEARVLLDVYERLLA